MKCHLQRLLLRVEASLFERSHDFIALLNLETIGSDEEAARPLGNNKSEES